MSYLWYYRSTTSSELWTEDRVGGLCSTSWIILYSSVQRSLWTSRTIDRPSDPLSGTFFSGRRAIYFSSTITNFPCELWFFFSCGKIFRSTKRRRVIFLARSNGFSAPQNLRSREFLLENRRALIAFWESYELLVPFSGVQVYFPVV